MKSNNQNLHLPPRSLQLSRCKLRSHPMKRNLEPSKPSWETWETNLQGYKQTKQPHVMMSFVQNKVELTPAGSKSLNYLLVICISLYLSQRQNVCMHTKNIAKIFPLPAVQGPSTLSFSHDKNLWNITTVLFLSLYLGCATRAQPNTGLPWWTEAAFRGEREGFSRAFSSGLHLTTLLLGSSRGADGLASPRQPSVSLPPRFVIRSKTSC